MRVNLSACRSVKNASSRPIPNDGKVVSKWIFNMKFNGRRGQLWCPKNLLCVTGWFVSEKVRAKVQNVVIWLNMKSLLYCSIALLVQLIFSYMDTPPPKSEPAARRSGDWPAMTTVTRKFATQTTSIDVSAEVALEKRIERKKWKPSQEPTQF